MSRRDDHESDERSWKLLAERAAFVLSAETSEEVLERGLQLACALGDADLAVVHLRAPPSQRVCAVARGPELARFHRSQDIECGKMLAEISAARSDLLVLEDHQLRKLQRNMPAGCRSLVLNLKPGGELGGFLQLVTSAESSRLFSRAEVLKACAGVMMQGLSMRNQIAELRDTAERFKYLEDRLTVAAREAAEANQAKSAFLANISHEIRTPLGVMMGFADLALDAPGLGDETREYISAIRRNGQLVTEILGEVLDLSKIEASRMEIEEIRFPLIPMLNEVITFLGLHAREKGLQLSFEKIGALPKIVKTDPTRLRQILTNLIGNAVKFTERGHVTLSVRMVSPPKAGTPVQLEFTVSDTGIGIPPELKEKLFQPFTQLEVSTCRRFGGTGLGLTLSKQLVHALGGNLSLQSSEAGRGSVFTFDVHAGPFEGDLVVDGKTGATVAGQPLQNIENQRVFSGKRVLVIEDSEDNQLLISRYLAAVGMKVEIASNGFEGLEKVEQAAYDLVVLDIQMPGMDGHQVARILRDKGFSRPIVALTAHAFKEDRERAFRNGFNEYLTKPINRVVLLKTLGDRLGESALH